MTQCIARAIGVPGAVPPNPVWPGVEQPGDVVWKVTAPPSTSVPIGLDDPRWQGGLRIGHPPAVGGGEAATFRALWAVHGGQKALFLSWHVRADTTADPGQDVLWVGLERAAGDPLIINIEPFSSEATKLSGPIAALAVFTLGAGSDVGTPLPGSPPDWITQNTRAWFDNASKRWAVQMRVPVDADPNLGVNLPPTDTFRMWYEMKVLCPLTTCVPHRWPYTAAVVTESGFPPQHHFPKLDTWDTFHLSTGPGDPVCPTTGFVSLAMTDVGTTNVPTSRIDPSAENTFEAKPLNNTGSSTPIAPGGISATFRIANWGSIADPNAPWDLVPATGGTTNPAPNGAAIANGAKGSNILKWTLSATDRDKFKPPIGTGTKDPHQCILVELSGSGLVFQPSSVWTNMNVRSTASPLEQVAEINTVGLGEGPGGRPDRDTFLLVEKLNMAARTGGREPPEGPRGPDLRRAGDDVGDDRDPDRVLQDAAAAAMTEEERLDATMPVYRVHVYHDTGETVVHKGVTLRCLTPGTSFGYWVRHDGTPAGWDDEIRGATRVGPNYWRLRAPAEGVVQVVTVVEPLERPRGLLGWLLWLLRWLLRLLRRQP